MELIVAMALVSTVLFTATTLMINFQKRHASLAEGETSLIESLLLANEGIADKVLEANNVNATGGNQIAIDIYNDKTCNASTTHTYSLSGTDLQYQEGGGTVQTIASEISSVAFTKVEPNLVKIEMAAQPGGGTNPIYAVETSVTARCRSAQ